MSDDLLQAVESLLAALAAEDSVAVTDPRYRYWFNLRRECEADLRRRVHEHKHALADG